MDDFLDNDDLRDPDLVRRAYREGVPMGGVLPQRSPGARPRLLVWADMDPASAQLDRIQIIKGGIDETGRSYERVFDVAASGARTRDPQTGQFPPVGNTVDVENATWTNTIGAAHLEALWIDEEFDSERDAFYYVRVLEIPTPRRSTYDAKLLGVDAPDPTTIQERAATSPIWYEAPPVTR